LEASGVERSETPLLKALAGFKFLFGDVLGSPLSWR
jgi:hypothetical protein